MYIKDNIIEELVDLNSNISSSLLEVLSLLEAVKIINQDDFIISNVVELLRKSFKKQFLKIEKCRHLLNLIR